MELHAKMIPTNIVLLDDSPFRYGPIDALADVYYDALLQAITRKLEAELAFPADVFRASEGYNYASAVAAMPGSARCQWTAEEVRVFYGDGTIPNLGTIPAPMETM